MRKRKTLTILAVLWAGLVGPAQAAPPDLTSAKLTEIFNEVRISGSVEPAAAPASLDPAPRRIEDLEQARAAVVGDLVRGDRSVLTGRKSKAELLFNNGSIARLGANSTFSFKAGSREVNLNSGFLLLHAPKGKGGAKVTTPTATAAVLGTTIMVAVGLDGSVKLVVLEGTATLSFNGQVVTVQAGQVSVYTPGQGISSPITIDIAQLVATSSMLNSFQGTLGSEYLIQEVINQQELLKQSGGLTVQGDQNGLKILPDSGIGSVIDAQTSPSSNPPPAQPPPSRGGGGGGIVGGGGK